MKGLIAALIIVLCAFFSVTAGAQNPAQDGVYVLTAGSRWRKHYTFIPPMVSRQSLIANGLDPDSDAQRQDLGRFNREAVISPVKREIYTPAPPDNWMSPDFDDIQWLRRRGGDFVPLFTIDPTPATYNAMLSGDPFIEQIGFIAMRGKFAVDNPAAIANLKLSIEYRGGFVAYLNGVEIARGHVPAGDISYDVAAEDYPLSAYLDRNGNPTFTAFTFGIHSRRNAETDPFDPTEPRWRERVRRADIENIDVGLLRRGVNVLAIQLHRTDYPIEVREFAHSFAPIGVHNVSLSAATRPANVLTSLAPPAGFRVWNEHLWSELTTEDFGDPVEELRPIRIEGARNGQFTGMVMTGSTRPINGIRASASALTGEGGAVIPAERITIRYGQVNPSRGDAWIRWDSGLQPFRFDMLLTEPPRSINPYVARASDDWTPVIRAHNNLPQRPTPYAIVPVMMTVDVPRDVPAGLYSGILRIIAPRQGEVSVPVNLRVSAWTIPDNKDRQSVVFFTHDYDNIARRYDVEPWSDAHWRLIETSLEMMAEIGNAGLFLGICSRDNQLAEIVRTTRRRDGTLAHDYSRLERYLDLAMKHHDRLEIIVLQVFTWRAWGGTMPRLNVIDERTGQREFLEIPTLGSPESAAILTPLLHGVRNVLARRGLDHLMMIGTPYDPAPAPEIVAMFRNILPGTLWYRVSHDDMYNFPYDARDRNLRVPVGCTARVPRHIGTGMFNRPGPPESWMNLWEPFWQGDPNHMRLLYNRVGTGWSMHDFPEPWRYRGFFENAVLRGFRGVGNICFDAFATPRERYRGILRDWQFSLTGMEPGLAVATLDVAARGPNGAVHSVRSMNMIEGVQETDARIAVWRALTPPNRGLPAEFTERAEKLFELRTQAIRTLDANSDRILYHAVDRHYTEYGAVGWQDLNRELFDLAADIERYLLERR